MAMQNEVSFILPNRVAAPVAERFPLSVAEQDPPAQGAKLPGCAGFPSGGLCSSESGLLPVKRKHKIQSLIPGQHGNKPAL